MAPGRVRRSCHYDATVWAAGEIDALMDDELAAQGLRESLERTATHRGGLEVTVDQMAEVLRQVRMGQPFLRRTRRRRHRRGRLGRSGQLARSSSGQRVESAVHVTATTPPGGEDQLDRTRWAKARCPSRCELLLSATGPRDRWSNRSAYPTVNEGREPSRTVGMSESDPLLGSCRRLPHSIGVTPQKGSPIRVRGTVVPADRARRIELRSACGTVEQSRQQANPKAVIAEGCRRYGRVAQLGRAHPAAARVTPWSREPDGSEQVRRCPSLPIQISDQWEKALAMDAITSGDQLPLGRAAHRIVRDLGVALAEPLEVVIADPVMGEGRRSGDLVHQALPTPPCSTSTFLKGLATGGRYVRVRVARGWLVDRVVIPGSARHGQARRPRGSASAETVPATVGCGVQLARAS